MSIDTSPARTPEHAPSAPLLDLPVTLIDGSSVSVGTLLDRYYTSPFATYMQTQQKLRFSTDYGYDPDAMLSDIGPDVCPVGHQKETVRHALTIIEREQADGSLLGVFDDEELATALLAFGIHDCGECEDPALYLEPDIKRLVGDIPAGKKTSADREAEAAVRGVVYRTVFADVDPRIIGRVEEIIAHTDTTVYHDLFLASHEAQTLDTVVHAEDTLYNLDHFVDGGFAIDDARMTGVLGMARRVRERARDEASQRAYYGHLRDLLVETASPRTRHHLNHSNQPYHHGHAAA